MCRGRLPREMVERIDIVLCLLLFGGLYSALALVVLCKRVSAEFDGLHHT